MSIPKLLSPALSAFAVLVAVGGLAATCTEEGPREGPPDSHYYENFQTAVASVSERNFTVYWFGQEFESGGILFRGPTFADFGGTNDADHMSYDYCARIPDDVDGRCVNLEVRLFSKAEWASRETGILPPERVTLIDADLEEGDRLYQRTDDSGKFYDLAAVLHRGDTVVVTFAAPDENPLANRDNLVRVLQDLRPYPE